MDTEELMDLCRCCISKYDMAIDVFSETRSNHQKYFEVIMESAPVQIARDDGLPSHICDACVSFLESFIAFRKKCVQSESILTGMLKGLGPREGNAGSGVDGPRDSDVGGRTRDDAEIVENADACRPDPNLQLYLSLQECVYLKDEAEQKDAQLPVEPVCVKEEREPSETETREHAVDALADVPAVPEEPENRREGPKQADARFRCDPCGATFSHRRRFETHECAGTSFPCDRCDKTFASRSKFAQHAFKHREKERHYTCERCSKTFAQKHSLLMHLFDHTGKKRRYACDVCGKSFHQRAHLARHERGHAGEKRFECDECDKTFVHRRSLIWHVEGHAGREKTFRCGLCDKAYGQKAWLKTHEQVHFGPKRLFPCDRCERVFKTKKDLRYHGYSHTGEKKEHACGLCDRSFFYKCLLDEHMNVHTGDKPFPCDVCGKPYGSKGALHVHKYTHAEKQRVAYHCDQCDVSYPTVAAYESHLQDDAAAGEKRVEAGADDGDAGPTGS